MKGDILYSPRFQFEDGTVTEKLLIVLNDPAADEPAILVLTTSKQHKKSAISGCSQRNDYYVIPKGQDWFSAPVTWVMFDTVMEEKVSELSKMLSVKKVIHKAKLKDQTIRAIINCIKGSSDISSIKEHC